MPTVHLPQIYLLQIIEYRRRFAVIPLCHQNRDAHGGCGAYSLSPDNQLQATRAVPAPKETTRDQAFSPVPVRPHGTRYQPLHTGTQFNLAGGRYVGRVSGLDLVQTSNPFSAAASDRAV